MPWMEIRVMDEKGNPSYGTWILGGNFAVRSSSWSCRISAGVPRSSRSWSLRYADAHRHVSKIGCDEAPAEIIYSYGHDWWTIEDWFVASGQGIYQQRLWRLSPRFRAPSLGHLRCVVWSFRDRKDRPDKFQVQSGCNRGVKSVKRCYLCPEYKVLPMSWVLSRPIITP